MCVVPRWCVCVWYLGGVCVCGGGGGGVGVYGRDRARVSLFDCLLKNNDHAVGLDDAVTVHHFITHFTTHFTPALCV